MIVVSDTSPLNYLVLIELQDILPKLFGRIVSPAAVDRELRSPAAPDAIKRFMATVPDWFEIQSPSEIEEDLGHLDQGEREVLSLALFSCRSTDRPVQAHPNQVPRTPDLSAKLADCSTGCVGILLKDV